MAAATKGSGKRPFRVLAIDGGGIRGIVPAKLLAEIEARTGKPISQSFDLVCGTSTGGIIALGLSVPDPDTLGQPKYTAAELVDFYRENGPAIFDQNIFQKLRGLAGRYLGSDKLERGLGHTSEIANRLFLSMGKPRYDPAGLEQALADKFGGTKLSDALVSVMIPAYDQLQKGAQFLAFHKESEGSGPDFLMRDAARATSAAPTYFPPATVWSLPGGTDAATGAILGAEKFSFVDGGIHSNNPAEDALVDAETLKAPDQEIVVVSIGTGEFRTHTDPETIQGWGAIDWASPLNNTPLLAMPMDAQADRAERSLTHRLGNNYQRINLRYDAVPPKDRPAMALDDASPENIAKLEAFADQVIMTHDDQLDRIAVLVAGEDPGATDPTADLTATPTARGRTRVPVAGKPAA